jgi:uncharacterized repeat protein (TIGR01451 family)
MQYGDVPDRTFRPGTAMAHARNATLHHPYRWGRFKSAFKPLLLCVVLAFALLFVAIHSTQVARSATLVVTNTNDSGPGSLRQAINDAVSGDTITFSPEVSGTITLTSGELTVNRDLTITGPSSTNLAISGNRASRVLSITTGVSVTLSGLSVADGYAYQADGGGIYNSGTLHLVNSAIYSSTATPGFYNNQVVYGLGGGIFNQGTLTLTHSVVHDNYTICSGGGLYNLSGTVTLIGSVMYGNWANGGGGLYNQRGTVALTDSAVYGHWASSGGGLFTANGGSTTLTRSEVFSNTASSGGGLVTYYSGTLTLVNSAVYNNTANSQGGGLWNWGGTVAMTDSVVYSNQSGEGGGLYAGFDGKLTLTRCNVYSNSATGGGGIYTAFNSMAILDNSAVYANVAEFGDGGGGLYNTGVLTLTGSMVYSNTTTFGGGGISNNGGTVAVNNSLVYGNQGGHGGGISNKYSGQLSLVQSKVYSNVAGNGGGIYTSGYGSLTLFDSQLYNNHAGLCGGGLATISGALLVVGSTIYGNQAELGSALYTGSSLYNWGDLALINTTISGNHSTGHGAVYLDSGSLSRLNNVTLSYNSAMSGTGGIEAASNVTLTVSNSIISDNAGDNCKGALFSVGYNLDSGNSCGFSATGDLTNTDPLLGPLIDNGGSTLTQLLQAGSPAIDAGDPGTPGTGGNTCAATDQRGIIRPQGARCDIGALEATYTAELNIHKQASSDIVVPGQTLTYTIAFRNMGLVTATDVIITDPVPSLLTNLSFASSRQVTPTSVISYTWQISDLAPGAGGIITVTSVVSQIAVWRVTFTNTAVITSAAVEVGTANNASAAVVTAQGPRASFSGAYIIPKNVGVLTIPVTLDLSSVFTATVDYATQDGTAIASSDYIPTTGTLVFAPGSTRHSIPVTILNNPDNTVSRALTITLSNPSNCFLGPPDSITVIIASKVYELYVSFMSAR